MEQEINILDYLKIVVKRWKLIVSLIVIFAVIALVYSLNLPKLYRASVSIMPVDASMGSLASVVASLPFVGGASGGGGESRLTAILGSYALAKQVAASLDRNDYFPRLMNDRSMKDPDREKAIAGGLQGSIMSRSEDGLMIISATWTDADRAAGLANLYVKELGKFLNQRSMNVNFQVIDPATPPEARFSPKIRPMVFLAGVVGCLAGIFLAFFLEYLPIMIKEIKQRG